MHYLNRVKKLSHLIHLTGDFPMPAGDVTISGNTAVFENEILRVSSVFEDQPQGFVLRSDRVENRSSRPLCIRTALSRFCLNGGDYEVYTQYSQWQSESHGAWQTLHTSIGGRNSDARSNTSAAPFFAICDLQNGRCQGFHILDQGMWQFEVQKHFLSGGNKQLWIEVGLEQSNLAITLRPGERLELPQILYYSFRDRRDMEAYRLHRWCKSRFRPKAFPAVFNSWMANFDDANLESLTAQLELAAQMGLEYFVMDAGWFGAPHVWFGSVGDWEESMESSLKGQLAILADRVREKGLKFGLWFEIERASLRSKAAREHPEHFIFQSGNAFLNFASPAAREYALEVLEKNIRKYGVEYIKFDFNACLTYDEDQSAFRNYTEGYRMFTRQLGERFPEVYLENCASGGLRMSLSSLEGFDSFWISDNHSLYTQLEIFKNTLLRMPSRALETWLSLRSLEHFTPVYGGGEAEMILSSGDASWGQLEMIPEDFLMACALGGPIGISCDLTRLSVQLREKLAGLIRQFKEDRAFWLDSETHILCDRPKLLALQFCDEEFSRVKICVFGKHADQNAVTIYPKLTPGAAYLHTDGTEYTAEALEAEGLEIPLQNICASYFELKKI